MATTNQNSWWLTQVVLKFKSLVEITRKLHKKSPIYFYTIYYFERFYSKVYAMFMSSTCIPYEDNIL